MNEKTARGLKWIVGILNKNDIPYRIGGGLAAYVYGSRRPINDIDISVSGAYFSTIIPEVSDYIVAGPKHYLNEKWDCDTLSLDYHGQEIDLTDVDTLRMTNKDQTAWIQAKTLYDRYEPVILQVEGVNVSLFDPRGLIEYKKELGREHQAADIEAVEKYLAEHATDAEVYNNPKYYELAFSFREITAEVDFIEQVIGKYSQVPVKTFLELASGNSPHMKELCERGYDYIGVELNDEMVAFANKKIQAEKLAAEVVAGDMINFSLAAPADCALVFLGSLYVKNDQELLQHLSSVAESLHDGGLYILESVVSYFPEDVHKQSWDMEDGELKVITTYDPTWVNEAEHLMGGKITLEIQEGQYKKTLEHTEVKRIYTFSEFLDLATKTGQWECVASFSDFDFEKEPREGVRNICVLRKK